MHSYNLILAVIWLLAGVWLLVIDRLQPVGGWTIQVGATHVSLLGLVALALAAYNLARWWGRRASHQAKQRQAEIQRRREYAQRQRQFRESGQAPDPNFIFDKPPEDADA